MRREYIPVGSTAASMPPTIRDWHVFWLSFGFDISWIIED
jgi:hypothetical protein